MIRRLARVERPTDARSVQVAQPVWATIAGHLVRRMPHDLLTETARISRHRTLSLSIMSCLARRCIRSPNSRATRRPEIEVSGMAVRHVRVTSSTTLRMRNRHPTLLRFPRIKGARRPPVTAAQIGTCRAGLMLVQNTDNLLFAVSRSLHCPSLRWVEL